MNKKYLLASRNFSLFEKIDMCVNNKAEENKCCMDPHRVTGPGHHRTLSSFHQEHDQGSVPETGVSMFSR